MTLSPILKLLFSDFSTTPTASIPGVCGYDLVIPLFPVEDNASL